MDLTVGSITRLLKQDVETVKEWDDFNAIMPQSDSAEEYVQLHPESFFVPFEHEFKTLGLRLQVINYIFNIISALFIKMIYRV
jgi:hypothetical protein